MSSTNLTSNIKSGQNILLKFIPYIAVALILLILPPFLPTYFLSMLTKVVIFAIFAMSFNLVLGYTGLLSLGHAVFLGVAGYAFGLLMVRGGIHSIWVLVPSAIVITGIVAAITGYIALRISGIYFLLITLAFGQLFSVAALKWRTMTGGTDGLVGIRYPDFGISGFSLTDFNFYYLVFIAFVIVYFILYRIINSSFGHALVGIRENESRMESLGYNTWLYKYLSFIIGGILGGVAGVLFASYYGAMLPDHLGMIMSTTVTLMLVIGSPGTLFGPLIGSLVYVALERLSSIYTPERWPLILGGVFILCVVFLPKGIGIYLSRLWRRFIH